MTLRSWPELKSKVGGLTDRTTQAPLQLSIGALQLSTKGGNSKKEENPKKEVCGPNSQDKLYGGEICHSVQNVEGNVWTGEGVMRLAAIFECLLCETLPAYILLWKKHVVMVLVREHAFVAGAHSPGRGEETETQRS